jgi:hypothetical protein
MSTFILATYLTFSALFIIHFKTVYYIHNFCGSGVPNGPCPIHLDQQDALTARLRDADERSVFHQWCMKPHWRYVCYILTGCHGRASGNVGWCSAGDSSAVHLRRRRTGTLLTICSLENRTPPKCAARRNFNVFLIYLLICLHTSVTFLFVSGLFEGDTLNLLFALSRTALTSFTVVHSRQDNTERCGFSIKAIRHVC